MAISYKYSVVKKVQKNNDDGCLICQKNSAYFLIGYTGELTSRTQGDGVEDMIIAINNTANIICMIDVLSGKREHYNLAVHRSQYITHQYIYNEGPRTYMVRSFHSKKGARSYAMWHTVLDISSVKNDIIEILKSNKIKRGG